MLEIVDENGEIIRYVTAAEAAAYFSAGLGVTAQRVRDWKRRRLITGYRLPPRPGITRSTREMYYRLDELKEVEHVLRSGGRGRRRGSS